MSRSGRACSEDDQITCVMTPPTLDAHSPTTFNQRHGLVFPEHLGAGLLSQFHQVEVKTPSGPHCTMCGKGIEAGPFEFPNGLVGDHPQAIGAVGIIEADAQIRQGFDCAGRQTITADLVSPARTFFENRHLRSSRCSANRHSRAGWSAAYDEDVALDGSAHPTSLTRKRHSPKVDIETDIQTDIQVIVP